LIKKAALIAAALLACGCTTPMMRAAERGDYDAVSRMLQDKSRKPSTREARYDAVEPLRLATMNNDARMIRLLLDNGVKPSTYNLVFAGHYGNEAAARLFVERGADPYEALAWCEASTCQRTTMSILTKLRDEANARKAPVVAARPAPAPPAPAEPAASLPAPLSPVFSSPERVDDLAVIVGIETYSDIASKAPYAERDADAFKAHVRALGVPERNIVLLKGPKAGKASLEKNLDQWLPRMAKADSRVYFYFSGHGAPDVKTGQAYLVPWDGDPNFLESTGYSVAKLYKKLGELPAKQVLVAMDSCFSGAGGRSVLASGARPLVGRIDTGAVPARITVLAASAANEISGSLDDKGHGAFTYFLLEGLNAGKTTPKALAEYLTPRVQDEARRLNRDQTPQLQGDGGWPLR
jgi:hypothetical protein